MTDSDNIGNINNAFAHLITLEAKMENYDKFIAFFDEKLSLLTDNKKIHSQLNVVMDEIISNVIRYAYDKNQGDLSIELSLIKPKTICIKFIDNGVPFNPLDSKEANTTASLEDRKIGGLGIFIVSQIMDSLDYKYENNQNILTLTKDLTE